MAVIINKETCTGCGACIETCPVEALEMVDEMQKSALIVAFALKPAPLNQLVYKKT
jgi:ferredoxin